MNNIALPKVEVDPETYECADGNCSPANQRRCCNGPAHLL